ncbi:MAG: hypothetical protein ACK518_00575 [bacterium]
MATNKQASQQMILEKATHYCQSISAGEGQQLAEIGALQKSFIETAKSLEIKGI